MGRSFNLNFRAHGLFGECSGLFGECSGVFEGVVDVGEVTPVPVECVEGFDVDETTAVARSFNLDFRAPGLFDD